MNENLLRSNETEQTVLGSILLDNDVMVIANDMLTGEEFYLEAHRLIYSAMRNLYKNGKAIDLIVLVEYLKDKVQLEACGGIPYITSLSTIVPTTANASYYINILLEKYKNRQIYNKFNLFTSGQLDSTTLMYQLQKDIADIDDKIVQKDTSINSIAERALNYISESETSNIKTGIGYIDSKLGGLFKGELTCIAAKSGYGKTALALQIIRGVISQKKKVLLISGEMTDIQIYFRMISSITGIDITKMKNRNLGPRDLSKFIEASAFLNNGFLHINDSVNTIEGIKREINRVKPDVVVLDYLQILDYKGKETGEAKLAELSREMKKMTLDFYIPIIELAQLNDEMKDVRPIGDRPLRGSKQIYMDANNVIYIHRPNFKELKEVIKYLGLNDELEVKNKENEYKAKLSEIIIAKNRDGMTGYKPFWYVGKILTFKDKILVDENIFNQQEVEEVSVETDEIEKAQGIYDIQIKDKLSKVLEELNQIILNSDGSKKVVSEKFRNNLMKLNSEYFKEQKTELVTKLNNLILHFMWNQELLDTDPQAFYNKIL